MILLQLVVAVTETDPNSADSLKAAQEGVEVLQAYIDGRGANKSEGTHAVWLTTHIEDQPQTSSELFRAAEKAAEAHK